MHLTRTQFLIIALVFFASVAAWGIVLKMFLDSSLEFKWSVFVWFFGACIVAALVGWSIQITGAFKRKRHATLNKNNLEINDPLHEYAYTMSWLGSSGEPSNDDGVMSRFVMVDSGLGKSNESHGHLFTLDIHGNKSGDKNE